jgi:uncharacterized protein (DUF362 family)/NAD-dependent dihydropyrimidine dehydrogenase PreA subunit
MEKVAVELQGDYDLKSVQGALRALLGKLRFRIKNGATVFIKPNIMSQNRPDQHTVTHYAVIDALCAILSEHGCRILIGDSIAFFQKGLTRRAFVTTKIAEVARKYGAELAAFDEAPLVRITRGLTVFDELYLPSVILEADMVINACKLKTHGGGLRFSGAVKNMFGCLPGGFKQKAHIRVKSDFELSDLFIDIMQTVRPALHVMDAVIGLDGGPSALGKARRVGALLAATNPAALDAVACGMIGYEPEEIAILVRAKARGLISDFNNIKVLGAPPRVCFKKLIKTPLPARKKKDGMFVTDTFVYPAVNMSKCTACKECLAFCPAGAVRLTDAGAIVVDYNTCIFCYYCLSACKEGAFFIRSSPKNKFIRFMRFVLGF